MTLYLVEHFLSTRLRPEGLSFSLSLFQMSIDRYAIKRKERKEKRRNKDRLMKTIDATDYQSLVCQKILQGYYALTPID